jgi:hypothetical protein
VKYLFWTLFALYVALSTYILVDVWRREMSRRRARRDK